MKRLVTIFSLLAAAVLHANVKLPALFSDHIVLQRGKPVAVWGWADPGEEVTVKFGDQSKKATADQDGAWGVKLDELKASSEPAELRIKGKNEIVLQDVLVGEVWICSGQSNMGFKVERAVNAADDIAKSANPQIRMFTVPLTTADEPQKDLVKRDDRSVWLVADPKTTGGFTAAGYFFGRELQKELKVPVGLINTSWGGTRAEAWTSKPALEAVPTCKAIIAGWDEFLKGYDAAKDKEKHEALAKLAKAKIERVKADNAKPGAPKQPVPAAMKPWDDQTKSQHRPSVLFNAMIAPIVPFTAKGAIWYQGESNQGRAAQYRTLLPTMIKDWRKQWGDTLSFYIEQLAGYGNKKPQPPEIGADDTWAELQWTQLQTAITLQKCGIAVANDIGEENDIHPKNKQEVGRRLALQALAKDYGRKDLVPGGPIYGGGDTMGNKYMISFSNIGGGLKSRDGGDLKGFIIAGEDKVWKPAKAKVVGKQVQVWNEGIAKPVAVRYFWQSWNPEANLVNKEGLPASIFRTDKWDLSTKGQENPFAQPAAAKPKAKPASDPAKDGGKVEVRPALIPENKAPVAPPAKKKAA